MSKTKVITGARAKLMLNGVEVAYATDVRMTIRDKETNEKLADSFEHNLKGMITLRSDTDHEKVEEIGRLLREALENSLVFRQRLEVESLEPVFASVTFVSDGDSWRLLKELPQDTSTDELIKWMDERALMTDEEKLLEVIWELSGE